MPRVLVVGIVPSLTWSVTRCLCLSGLRPTVLGWHSISPLMLVPGCTYVPMRRVQWNGDQLDPELLTQIEAACRSHQIDRVLAVDFPSIELLARHGHALDQALCAVPDADSMRLLHDKWQFSRALARLGLPQPATEIASDRAALEATELAFPVITKPLDRWAGLGFQVHQSPAMLRARVRNNQLTAEFPVLVQEFIPGRDVGFAFIARRGRIVAHAAFEQQRRGVRRYFDAPALRQHVCKLVEASRYHGVGEIDARHDLRTGEYRLLEINPRFWASVLYAARAGMNFPSLLVRLDEHLEVPAFHATPHPVKMSAFELAVSKAMQAAENVRNAWARWNS